MTLNPDTSAPARSREELREKLGQMFGYSDAANRAMHELDYYGLEDALNNRHCAVMEKIESIEPRLIEKAQVIASRMTANADQQLYDRLVRERQLVVDVGEMMDIVKESFEYWAKVVNGTRKDYWASAEDGAKMKSEIHFLKGTYTIMSQQEKEFLEIIKKQAKEIRILRENAKHNG